MSKNTVITLVTVVIVLVLVNVVFWSIVLGSRSSARSAPIPALPTLAALPTAQPTNTPSARPLATAVPAAPATATNPPASPTPTPSAVVLTTVDAVTQAASAGQHGAPFRLVFTEQEISNEVTTYLAANPDLVFRDVNVSLQTGQAIITGKAHVLNFDVGFKATTTITLVDGQPRLKVLSLDVLGGLIPGFIKDQLIQMIEQGANLPLLGDLPVVISDVSIQPGQAVVVGNVI